MVEPVAVEKNKFCATKLRATYISLLTFTIGVEILMILGALIYNVVLLMVDTFSILPLAFVKKKLGAVKLLVILTVVAFIVTIWFVSVAIGLIVEIDNVYDVTSITELRSPKIEETIEEISFTTLFVANAPKLTGE
jgi:hypothetical protein